jgi:hypothetical protein
LVAPAVRQLNRPPQTPKPHRTAPRLTRPCLQRRRQDPRVAVTQRSVELLRRSRTPAPAAGEGREGGREGWLRTPAPAPEGESREGGREGRLPCLDRGSRGSAAVAPRPTMATTQKPVRLERPTGVFRRLAASILDPGSWTAPHGIEEAVAGEQRGARNRAEGAERQPACLPTGTRTPASWNYWHSSPSPARLLRLFSRYHIRLVLLCLAATLSVNETILPHSCAPPGHGHAPYL